MGNGKVTTDHVNQTMNAHVAEGKAIATEREVKKAFESSDTLRYFKNDTFIANPALLLGSVFYMTEGSKELKKAASAIEGTVDEKSILKSPQTRSELILDTKAAVSADILSYLSVSLSADELYELRVIDNTAARLVDRGDAWNAALLKWMANPLSQSIISNPKVGLLGVATGMVQKYISTKKYRKFEAGAKGGAFGVNVNGSLYTSSTEFALDIVYGLDLVLLPQTTSVREFVANVESKKLVTDPNQLRKFGESFVAMSSRHSNLFTLG